MIGNEIVRKKQNDLKDEDFTILILPVKVDLLFFSFCYTLWSHIGQSVAKSHYRFHIGHCLSIWNWESRVELGKVRQ